MDLWRNSRMATIRTACRCLGMWRRIPRVRRLLYWVRFQCWSLYRSQLPIFGHLSDHSSSYILGFLVFSGLVPDVF